MPLERPMPGPWTTLVDATTLKAHMDDPSIVLLDCRHELGDPEAGRRKYLEGHLPGARFAHVDEDLAAPVDARSGRHPLPDPERFRERCSTWGIGPDSQVVAYDDAGGAFAARAWWLLRHYGHDNVAVLDGGIQSYLGRGGALTEDIPHVEPTTFHGAPGHLPTVDTLSITNRVPVDTGVLLDARDPARFRGDVEPLDPAAGHIPGAVNVPFKQNLDPHGRFKAPDELEALYLRAIGGRDPEEVAVYCGSGVTAAHDLLAMAVAGLHGAALYPGSWSQWCSDPERPVATGEATIERALP